MSSLAHMIAEEIFQWAFSLALVFAVVDWIRPLTVSPHFNVAWLIVVLFCALSVIIWQGDTPKASGIE